MNSVLIDVTYDKNKLGFQIIDSTFAQLLVKNPTFKIYTNNQIEDNQLICEKRANMIGININLNQYRNIEHIYKQYSNSSPLGYLNIHNTSPFKSRELTDKYIIENEIEFQAPQQYYQVYFHIRQNELMQYSIYYQVYYCCDTSVQCDEEQLLTTYQISEVDNLPKQSIEESNRSLIYNFLQVINKFNDSGIVFLIGMQCILEQSGTLIKLLTSNNYNPQFTIKSNKQQARNSQVIKQITNIDELSKCYFININDNLNIQQDNSTQLEFREFKFFIKQYIKSRNIQVQLKLIEYLQIPLSFALYETTASNIHTFILRNYWNSGYMFVYNSNQINKQKQKIIAGLYNQAPEDLQQCILENIAEGDFFSLYGTIVVSKNISYETVKENSHSNEYNDGKADEGNSLIDRVLIDNKRGIIPSILEPLLKRRRGLTDDEKIDKQVLKLILASTCGLFGSEFYSIYSPLCFNLIVEFGRKACNVAKEILKSTDIADQVIQQQTDSCLFTLGPASRDPINQRITWEKLNQQINKSLGCKRSLFRFKYETDKFAIKMIIPRAKNSQISLIEDKKNQQTFIQVKGDLYSENHSKYRNDTISTYFHQLLTDSQFKHGDKLSVSMGCNCNSNIQQEIHTNHCFFGLYKQEEAILKNLIEIQDIQSIINKYSIYLKYSQDDSRCQYIQKNYNITKQGGFRFLFFGDRIIPTCYLTIKNVQEIRIQQTISNMLRPIRSILDGESQGTGSKTQLYSKGFEEKIKTYAKISDIEAPQMPGETQCILRVECQGFKEFITRDFSDIYYLILENPFKSFHEVIHKDLNKMYFDIDSDEQISEHSLYRSINLILDKLLEVKIQPRIHKCVATMDPQRATKQRKFSYHFVIDIKCTKKMNLFLAQQMDDKYKYLTGTTKSIFDIGVYKGPNQSLRLPLCFKIDKQNQIDRRPFIIEGDSVFSDFIIGNTVNCVLAFNKIIHFDNDPPIDPARFCDSHSSVDIDDSSIIKFIANKTFTLPSQWKLAKNRVTCDSPYRCLVCDSVHSTDNLKLSIENQRIMVNCFSNVQRKGNIYKKVPIIKDDLQIISDQQRSRSSKLINIYQQINEANTFQQMATQVQNNQFVQFELTKPTTYVISDMGTGKSQQIKRIIDNMQQQQSVLCLSFRRTFSIEFANKYNLQNYMSIKGKLNSKTHKRLIVQIDSLCRYDLSTLPDLLIIDEIESIIERLQACHANSEICLKFMKLIQFAKNVVYMDGLIEKKTIEYLNCFRGCDDWDIIFNQYSPRKDYLYAVFPYISTYQQHVVDYFIKMATSKNYKNENKKIYGMVTSKNLGFYIMEQLRASGINAIFYHGSDERIQEDVSLADPNEEVKYSSHIDVKKKHFKDVNAYWKKYQVVLHNSAITAGISFDDDYFDIQINVYTLESSSALSFFQGCHRVRHLSEKMVITFLQHESVVSNMTSPYSIFNKELAVEKDLEISSDYNFQRFKQFSLWLYSRDACSYKYQTNILFKYLKRMNYQVILYDNSISTKQNITSWIKHYPITDLQLQNLINNHIIVGRNIDVNIKYYELLYKCIVVPADQDLYDENKRKCQIHKEKGNGSYAKLEKLKLKRLYTIGFENINTLNIKEIKILCKQAIAQEFRNNLRFSLSNDINPQQSMNWIDNMINKFRVLRNNSRRDDTHSIFTIQLIDEVQRFIKYFQDNPYDNDKAVQMIRKLKPSLRYLRTGVNVYISKNMKRKATIDQINQLLSLFFVQVFDQGEYLQFQTITKPMYQYLSETLISKRASANVDNQSYSVEQSSEYGCLANEVKCITSQRKRTLSDDI